MFIPAVARVLEYLPKGLVVYISKKIVSYFTDKYARIEITGKENLAGIDKPIIFISNHLSNSDGLILDKVLKEQDVTFIAGVKLSNNPVTNIGVNVVKTVQIKPNSADREAITKVVKMINGGNNVLIFPEGTRSRVGSMIEAKRGVLLIAKLTRAVIVPIGLYGTENLLPINDSGNMSAEKFQVADVKVNIGKPVSLPSREKEEDKAAYEERALSGLMKEIAVLLPEKYRGVYK